MNLDTKLKGKSDASKLVEINHSLVTLYNYLVAVKQEEQVTGNTFLLNTIIRWIPEKYQRELQMNEEGNAWGKKLCFKCQSSNHESRNCPGYRGLGRKSTL